MWHQASGEQLQWMRRRARELRRGGGAAAGGAAKSALFDTRAWVRGFERGVDEAWAVVVERGEAPRDLDL